MQIERVKWMWSGAPFGAQLTPDQSTSYSCTSSRFSRRKTTLHWFYKWMEKNFENGGNLRVRKRRLIWFKTASDTLDTSSFEASSQDRVGGAMAEKIRKFKRKMESITNGTKKRKRLQAETWVSIKPDEVKQAPKDVLTQLAEENEDLRKTIEETPPIYIGRWRKSLPTGVIYHSTLREGFIPPLLKSAIVHPLPKVTNPKCIEDDVRPISLTCQLAKVLEGFTLARVYPSIVGNLDRNQFAVAGKSIEQALVYLLRLALEALDRGGWYVRFFFLLILKKVLTLLITLY